MWNKDKYQEWKKKRIWYDVRNVLSYNAFYNFIIGMRNSGKTYSFKVKVVDRFLTDGSKFVWVRRRVIEKDETVRDFFESIANDSYLVGKWGEMKFENRGSNLYINGKHCGQVVALAQQQTKKSADYTRHNWIVYDEFISEDSTKSAYLPNEVEKMHNLVLTVQRWQTDVKVFFLGNSVKFNNPYMNYFRIKPFASGIKHLKKKNVLVQMYFNKYMIAKMKNSEFGKLVEGTSYFEYAILNQFKDNDNTFIEKKPNNALYYCSMLYEGQYFSFYKDYAEDKMYTVRNNVEDKQKLYVLTKENHDIDYMLVKNIRRTRLLAVSNYYQMGRLMFDNSSVREQVLLTLTLL